MSEVDTLEVGAATEQSTFAFSNQWVSYEVCGSTFPVQILPQSMPIASHWDRFIEGIVYQGSPNSTGARYGGTLAMDAYWDGPIRNRNKVMSALRKNPKMNGVLVQAQSKLAVAFGDGRLVLEGDPDGEQLYIVVETSLEVNRARDVLSEFDRNWWLKNMDDANGNLSVVLDLV